MKSYDEYNAKNRKYSTAAEMRELREDVNNLQKSYLKLRKIYQSGRRYNAKEWFKVLSDLLDDID